MTIDLSKAWNRIKIEDKTISGLDPDFDNYFEMYRDTFMEKLSDLGCHDSPSLEAALRDVIEFENVGDFLADPPEQLKTLAAFGLVLLDRIALTGWGKFDYQKCFFLHEQMFECFDYVQQTIATRKRARDAAMRKHSDNHAKKEKVFQWLDANMQRFKSMDAAAETISDTVVPVVFRTARGWVSEWKKLRSTGTP